MEIVAAPGHSPGFSVMFFPQEGIVYCGDIDLTNFGPSCRNSELFIESAYKIADLDADVFITSHETGIVSKAEFVSRLDQYLDVISQRDHKLLNALDKPMSLAEIAHKGTFYGPKILADEFVYYWEWTMVKEHLRRLINQSLVGMEQGYYVRY
jgi:glyoxylase-like metal-dependent hydrolase (beta-lactamase superfamily II)